PSAEANGDGLDGSPREDLIHTPESHTPEASIQLAGDAASPPIHWMQPLDHYKSVAHDLLGHPVPGLPDLTPQPTFNTLLPSFIQKLPPNLPDEDLQFLATKGAFSLPDETLRNELLKTFALHVHPDLPVLDLSILLEAIANNNGESRISLLLFHAVMFSSTASIDPKHIHRAGYTSRKAARQEFFRKARVLYDFDVERDRVILIQSVLLMTYWHETPEDPKDFRYWLEIALSLAGSIAFYNRSEWASETASKGLWKRIWWCMYTLDRLVALNLRRAVVIKDEDFTVPPPSMADFNIQRHPPHVLRMLGNCEVLRGVGKQQQLAQMFLEKCKLCTTISGLIFPISNASGCSPSVFTYYIQALENWQANLPSDIQYQAPESPVLSEGDRSLFAYRAWLEMIFLAASGALHRQRLGTQEYHPWHEQESPPERGIQRITQSMAVVAEGLHELDLVHCLPTTTVGLLMPVLATHIMNIRSDSPDLWGNAFRSFYQCMKVLEKLGEVYMLAESMASFFQSAICGDKDGEINAAGSSTGTPGLLPTAFLEKVLTASELKTFYAYRELERASS
ncbi:hypothetical protein ARAM_002973, partial [Aspergillus rambellii]